jgi:membrane protein
MLLGLYLGKASVGSAYGAAGSLVAVIVWVYYSAQIFFFGAEFTRVYADADERSHTRTVAQHATNGEVAPAKESVRIEQRGEPVRPKSRMAMLIAAGIAYLIGRNSVRQKRVE